MYTVKDLIQALQQCPQDYPIYIHNIGTEEIFGISSVGFDPNEETADLFIE